MNVLVTLAAAGLAGWLVLRKPSRRIIGSGLVPLAAGVPYRFKYVTETPLVDTKTNPTLFQRQTEIRTAVSLLGGTSLAFGRSNSLYTAIFSATPTITSTVTIGSVLSPVGDTPPKLRLQTVERLDGNSF